MTTPQNAPGWPELVRSVDGNAGVFKTTMLALRTIHGAGRINERIASEISGELKSRGLGHHPDPLPIRQEDEVSVFRLGSLGAELYQIIRNPQSNQEALVKAIRLLNQANEEASLDAMRAFEDLSKSRKRQRPKRPT